MLVVSAGIDPGTASFDITITEDGRVIHAMSVPSGEIASGRVKSILDTIREWSPDIVVGPSGYGTPIVCNDEITNPDVFAEKILLLSGYSDSVSFGFSTVGREVYLGVHQLVRSLHSSEFHTCYMPGVIHLVTVPSYKKLNKIDMGTVDKLASSFYIVNELSKTHDLSDIDAIVVEIGYGYNAVIEISEGKIVDGHGGTIVNNAFLSIGGLDSEIPSLLGFWSRELNFTGGVSTACNSLDPDIVFSTDSQECILGIKAMIDSLAKNIFAMRRNTQKPIFLTGRLSVFNKITRGLRELGLEARIWERRHLVKEASIGYALMGEGYMRGSALNVFRHMRLNEACGGTVDWVLHPAFNKVKTAFHRAVEESVAKESIYKFICNESLSLHL